MEWITEPQAWVALLTLTVLEIVLGIDNIVFISVLTGRLPVSQRSLTRRVGLVLAMFLRIGLLWSLSMLTRLTVPWFEVLGHGVSARNVILLVGGLFLLAKSTIEIHHNIEDPKAEKPASKTPSFHAALIQIAVLDIVFSLDSVITAVGMSNHLMVMIIAVVLAVLVMATFVNPVCNFIEHHPTVKMLALSFLLLIGISLVAESLDFEIPKGYLYFAMAFSFFVEFLNMNLRKQPASRSTE